MNQTIVTPQNITPEIRPLYLESNEAAFYFYYQIYRDVHKCNEEHLSEFMLRLTNGASFKGDYPNSWFSILKNDK